MSESVVVEVSDSVVSGGDEVGLMVEVVAAEVVMAGCNSLSSSAALTHAEIVK